VLESPAGIATNAREVPAGRPAGPGLAGTLAAVAHAVPCWAHLLRVHDVAEVADFLAVHGALCGGTEVDPALRLPDELRWEQGEE